MEETSKDTLTKRMRQDWDQRARENAYYYVYSQKGQWIEKDFFASGEKNVEESILNDMINICQDQAPSEMKVLEIGCGVGRMTRVLARIFGEVHALDVSGEMISKARDLLGSTPNVYLYQNNGVDLSVLGDRSFDFAFSMLVFQHIPTKDVVESYVGEVGRLLRPGRLFKFHVQGYPVDRSLLDTWVGVSFSAQEMAEMAERCGFELRYHHGDGSQHFWLWFFKKPS